MISCDVLVSGGGSAGIAAAVSAARAGADTLLVERHECLGGMGSAALVHTICGLYQLREEPGAVFANQGFASEFATRLQRSGGASTPVRMGRVDVLPHEPALFAKVADQIVFETPGLHFMLKTRVTSVKADGVRLESVEISRGRERETVYARAFIDTTGDATITALAGAAFSQVENARLQRPAYITVLRGLPDDLLGEKGRLTLAHAIVSAVKEGNLPREAMGAAFRRGVQAGDTFMTIDLNGNSGEVEDWDPTSAEALARVEVTGRDTAQRIARFIAGKFPDATDCSVSRWPLQPGIRESRRIAGVCELRGTEVFRGEQFEDGIACTAWPMELRERATGPRWKYPEGKLPAQIPLRALRHRDLENLWAAGRCLSADHEAQASIRVMGTCLATGEAAGIAAALTVGSVGITDWPALAKRVINTRSAVQNPC